MDFVISAITFDDGVEEMRDKNTLIQFHTNCLYLGIMT